MDLDDWVVDGDTNNVRMIQICTSKVYIDTPILNREGVFRNVPQNLIAEKKYNLVDEPIEVLCLGIVTFDKMLLG